MEPLSAIHRPGEVNSNTSETTPVALFNWRVDDDTQSSMSGSLRTSFDAKRGVLTIPKEGLYSIMVEVISTDGGAKGTDALRARKNVVYMVRIEEPPFDDKESEEDISILDVGPTHFGEVKHLRQGSTIEVLRQPKHTRRDSIRFMVDLIQRKRKRAPLSKKELKKLKKKKRKAAKAGDDESESDSDSSWGFSSDESCDDDDDELSKQSAKRARTGE